MTKQGQAWRDKILTCHVCGKKFGNLSSKKMHYFKAHERNKEAKA